MLEKINEKKRNNIIKKLNSWDKRKKEKQRYIKLKILDLFQGFFFDISMIM